MEDPPVSDQAEFTHTYDPRSPQVRGAETSNARSKAEHRVMGDSFLKLRKLAFGRTESRLVPHSFSEDVAAIIVGWEVVIFLQGFVEERENSTGFPSHYSSSFSDFEGMCSSCWPPRKFPTSVNAVFGASMDHVPMAYVVDLTRPSWRLASRILPTLSGVSPLTATSSSYWTFASSRLVAYPTVYLHSRDVSTAVNTCGK